MSTLTPWAHHKLLVAQAAKVRETTRIHRAQVCPTWEDRPLLCALGVHRPNKRLPLAKNCRIRHQCLRCGFEWCDAAVCK